MPSGEPKALPELEAELSLPPTGTVAVRQTSAESEGEARRKKKETQWEGQAEEDTPTSKKKKKNRQGARRARKCLARCFYLIQESVKSTKLGFTVSLRQTQQKGALSWFLLW